MDFFDVLAAMFPGDLGSGRRSGSPEDRMAGAVGCFMLPLVDFALVLFVEPARNVAMYLPLTFAALSMLVCRRVGASTGSAILTVFGCLVFCFLASGIAVLLVGIGSFYSTF